MNLNPEDKKKLGVIAGAAVAGLVAAILTGNYIQSNVEQKTLSLARAYEAKAVKPLQQEVQNLKKAIQQISAQQAQQQAALSAPGRGPFPEDLAEKAPSTPLAKKTPAGKRAITLMIDSLSAVGGSVNPGDYVDILAHLEIPQTLEDVRSQGKNRVTAMIFQNVQVLDVGKAGSPAKTGARQPAVPGAIPITFALDAQEVGLITFAQQNGKLQLVLRSPGETEIAKDLDAATWKTLSEYVLEQQGPNLKAYSPPEPDLESGARPAQIQIFRGGQQQ